MIAKLHPAHYQVQPGGLPWKILRRWAGRRRHQGRQKEEEQARWAGPGSRGASPHIQARITPLAGIATHPTAGLPQRPLSFPPQSPGKPLYKHSLPHLHQEVLIALSWTPPRSSLFLLSWTAQIIISGRNWSPGVLDSKPTVLPHLPSSFSSFLLPKQEAGAQRVAVMWLWSRFQTASPWGAV